MEDSSLISPSNIHVFCPLAGNDSHIICEHVDDICFGAYSLRITDTDRGSIIVIHIERGANWLGQAVTTAVSNLK